MKITNNAKGVRGINAKTGQVWINPGETVEADLEPAVLKRLEKHPDLTIEKGKAKADTTSEPKADTAPAARAAPAPAPVAPEAAKADAAPAGQAKKD